MPDALIQLPRAIAGELKRTAKDPEAAARALIRVERLRERGRMQDAVHAAERAKEAAPHSSVVRGILGDLLFSMERWKESISELSACRRLGGEQRVDLTIAEADHRAGRSARALERLEGLAADAPTQRLRVQAQLLRARIYVDMGKPEIARGLLEAARRNARAPR